MKQSKRGKNRWEDYYTRRAKKENYAARSVFKLQEIQKKYSLIKKGHHVLDLGCAPGSWLQYAADLTGPGGRVVGIDLKPVKINVPGHVELLTGDILDETGPFQSAVGEGFDVVLSDMAPATSGNRFVDSVKSFHLCEAALATACRVLKPGGAFICKIFQGEDFKQFTETVKTEFNKQKIFKPQTCRKASREIYIIAMGKKQEGTCQDTANGQPSNTKRARQMPNAAKYSLN